VVSTARFCAGWCSGLTCRQRSVCVDFLYTVCPSVPASVLLTRTSRNGKVLFCSVSIVNSMLLWILFRCCRKSCRSSFPCDHTTNISSTYLYHVAGYLIAALLTPSISLRFDSNCNIVKKTRYEAPHYGKR
jgi:hypothetical protein